MAENTKASVRSRRVGGGRVPTGSVPDALQPPQGGSAPAELVELADDYAKLTAIVGDDITDQAMLDRLLQAVEALSRADLEALLFFGVLATRQATIILARLKAAANV